MRAKDLFVLSDFLQDFNSQGFSKGSPEQSVLESFLLYFGPVARIGWLQPERFGKFSQFRMKRSRFSRRILRNYIEKLKGKLVRLTLMNRASVKFRFRFFIFVHRFRVLVFILPQVTSVGAVIAA